MSELVEKVPMENESYNSLDSYATLVHYDLLRVKTGFIITGIKIPKCKIIILSNLIELGPLNRNQMTKKIKTG